MVKGDSYGVYKTYTFDNEKDFGSVLKFQEGGGDLEMLRVDVELNLDSVPEGDREEIRRRVANAIREEFSDEGAKVSEGENQVTGHEELQITLDRWQEDEERKIKDRQKEAEETEEKRAFSMETAIKYAKEIPDSELPSHVQLWDGVRKFDYKVGMVLDKQAQEELKAQEERKKRNYTEEYVYDDALVEAELQKADKLISDESLPTILRYADEDTRKYYKYQLFIENQGKV